MTLTARRVYFAVAACAVVVYLGALANRFSWDDTQIIVKSDLVHSWSGLWRAFTNPYWPRDWGGFLYRPLTVSTFTLDWQIDGAMWAHAVNVVWHAGVSVLVAMLAWRWVGERGALVAGLLFAVHPVHVEAVANVVGRAELMAAAFTLLAVYGAVTGGSVWWSTLAWVLGLLSKENAVVAPGLIIAAWVAGLGTPPGRQRVRAFAVAWVLAGGVYLTARGIVLHPYAQQGNLAPAFAGQGPLGVRLTGVAALTDVLRLLVLPLTLRVDYSPDERTAVLVPWDSRFIFGVLSLACWAGLLVWAWRRQRRVEAFGLAWIGIAYAPVANLLFPVGVLVAERTLYLPSAGLALAAGAAMRDVKGRGAVGLLALLIVAGGIRSALRVPVWRSDDRVMLSILEDSPNSYRGPMSAGIIYIEERQPTKAIDALKIAIGIYPQDGRLYLLAAHAAFLLGKPEMADSILDPVRRACLPGCTDFYKSEADMARQIGDPEMADSLAAWARRRGTTR